MNRGGRIVTDLQKLIGLFAERCKDRGTLDELAQAAADRGQWLKTRGLLDRIRQKALVAGREQNPVGVAQYAFEEACAKTLYNLGGGPAPFDADSPYWIVPRAFALARRLGIADAEVLAIVAA
jgi:hypothetical protein